MEAVSGGPDPYQGMFDQLDKDNSGSLDINEIQAFFDQNVKNGAQDQNTANKCVEKSKDYMDENGQMSLDQFKK